MGLSFVSPLFLFCILFIYLLFCISLSAWTHMTHRPSTCLTEGNIGESSSSTSLTHAVACLCYTAYSSVASCEFPGDSFSVSSSYLSGITCKSPLLPFVPAPRGLNLVCHAPAKALFFCCAVLMGLSCVHHHFCTWLRDAASTTPILCLCHSLN